METLKKDALLKTAQVAHAWGISTTTINHARARGEISYADESAKVYSLKAIVEWRSGVRGQFDGREEGSRNGRSKYDPDGAGEGDLRDQKLQAQIENTQADTRLKEIEIQVKEGALVSVEAAHSSIVEWQRILTDWAGSVPDELDEMGIDQAIVKKVEDGLTARFIALQAKIHQGFSPEDSESEDNAD